MKDLTYSYKNIIKIALPLMISNFFYVMIAVTDIGFMQKVGVTEQAAIGYVSLLYLIFFMIGFSYTKGTQIQIAKKIGEKRPQAIGLIVDNTVVVLLTTALLLFLSLLFFTEEILEFSLQDPDVRQASLSYLEIRKYGFFFSFMGSVMIAYYSGIEKTVVLAIAIITMSLSNIFLNWALIFGNLGFPNMGIRGAALASNLAEGISLLILMAGVWIRKYRKEHQLFYFKKISISIIKKVSALSSPLVVQSLVGLGAWLVFFTLIEKMGEEELAISNVVKQWYTVLGIPTFALASTTNTVIGNVVGQRKVKEIIPLLKRIIFISIVFIVCFSLPAFIFPKQLIALIAEPSLVEASIGPFFVALIALQFYSFSTVLFNCIASIGSTLVSMCVEILTIVVYAGYLYFIFFIYDVSLTFMWTSELVYWLVIAVLCFIYLRFSGWRDKI